MANKKAGSWAKGKMSVILITGLFILSTVGAVFLQSPAGNGSSDIPKDQILTEPLTDRQQSMILSNFGIIVKAQGPKDSQMIKDTESLMRSFPKINVEDGSAYFVYLEESVSEDEEITIIAQNNDTSFKSFNQEKITRFICENSHPYMQSQYRACAILDM